jgi:hypothetical protein
VEKAANHSATCSGTESERELPLAAMSRGQQVRATHSRRAAGAALRRRPILAAVTAAITFGTMAAQGQLLHHSRSPDGPWLPVIPRGCNGSTGIWRDGGGGNQSPFFITEAVSKLTGLPNNSIVAITMFSNHPHGQPSRNATLNAYMAVGIAKTWRDPMVINPTPLFLGGVLTGWEDPCAR